MAKQTSAVLGHRPLLRRIVRRRVAAELKKQGHADATELAASLMDEEIDAAIAQTEGAAEAVGAVGAIGDGAILQKILDFLASPQGQALIALLIKILLGGI